MAKELISKDEYGVYATSNGTIMISSLDVARIFGKLHKNIIRDIENIMKNQLEFGRLNFEPAKYLDRTKHARPCYNMTRDGFTFLVMSFTGDKADSYKIAYINRFNEMESYIKTLNQARIDFPALTDRIKEMHDTPKPYHYSNEINMLYKIAIGMTAAEFRKQHGLASDENIRPHLTAEQLVLVVWLQQLDCALSYTISDFQERKNTLKSIVANQKPPQSLVKQLIQKS